jgi:prophage tail gpP-like protein
MQAEDDSVYLSTDGLRYEGWRSVSISRSLEAVSGRFELEISDRWNGMNERWQIEEGAACVISIGSVPVITGFIDTVTAVLSGSSSGVQISGRDTTGDLVDCSAIRKPPTWQRASFETIAKDLTRPFGIQVKFEVDTGKPFLGFSITQGETAFSCLERAAKLRQLVLTTNGKGDLLVTRPNNDKPSIVLEEGANILNATAHFDHSQRFSKYLVRSIPTTIEDEESSPLPEQSLPIYDFGIKRYRPLLVIAEGIVQKQTFAARANWELTTRRAKSKRPSITVAGWRSPSQDIWNINEVVRLKCPSIYIKDGVYIITSVHFSLDGSGGKRTILGLESSDAYKVDPTLETGKNTLLDWSAQDGASE